MSQREWEFPSKSEEVFKSDIDWQNNARIGWSHRAEQMYAQGYKRAAEKLLEQFTDTNSELDFLIYPIVFLYRHYVEITLKMIIQYDENSHGRYKRAMKSHDLMKLWEIAEPIIQEVYPEVDDEVLSSAWGVIKQIQDVDPGDSFRYATDIKGNRTLEDLQHINIRNYADVMWKLSCLLDTVIEAYYYKWDCESEMNYL